MLGIVFETGNLEALRVKVGEWSTKNFGNTRPKENTQAYGMLRCAAGMAEELSEMLDCGYGLTTLPLDQEEYLDGIADICVYALDFCYTADLDMQSVLLLNKEPNRWEKEFIKEPQRPSVPILHEGLGGQSRSRTRGCRC